MNIIAVVDEKWGLGKDNDLLFRLPLDMKHLRELTLGKVVVMGGNTLRSLPNGSPLKERTNIVLSKTINRDDCIIVRDLEQLKAELKRFTSEDIWIIGGASFYHTMLPYCKKAFITKVRADGKAQVFFDNLDLCKEWKLISQGEELETNGYRIVFCIYENNLIKAL